MAHILLHKYSLSCLSVVHFTHQVIVQIMSNIFAQIHSFNKNKLCVQLFAKLKVATIMVSLHFSCDSTFHVIQCHVAQIHHEL